MREKFYIFNQDGPYNWELSDEYSGPDYMRTYYFDTSGYDTEEEAKAALEYYYSQNNWGPYFIIKGYDKD